MSALRKDPKDLEHRMWQLYERAAKDWWDAKEGSAPWHQAVQTMALTSSAAMQAQQAKR